MDFTCHASKLLTGLNTVTRVLSTRTTNPILEGVLIKASRDGLQLTCSDGAVSIVTRVDADVSLEGSVVLPGRLFLDVVRKMPPSELRIRMDSGWVTHITCHSVRMRLTGKEGELFPALPIISAENSFSLPQAMLREMIQRTSFAIAVDDPRKVLNGCLMEIHSGELRIVALDGFRLGMQVSKVGGEKNDNGAIIPGKAISEMAKVLEEDSEELAMIQIGGNQLEMQTVETRLYTTLIDGEYIDYRRILPTSCTTSLTFDKDDLAMCVERCALIARESKSNLVKMVIEENKLTLSARSEAGETTEELDVDTEGDPLTIAFNVQYVSDILKVLPEGSHVLRFNTAVSPCVVCPGSEARKEAEEKGKGWNDFLYLMLPVRLTA